MTKLFKSLIRNPERTTYEGEDSDEKILYVIRKSLWAIVPNLIFVMVLTIAPIFFFSYLHSLNIKLDLGIKPGFITSLNIFWYLFTFGYLFQLFVNWYFNVFIITSKKIVDFDVRGLTYKNTSETALRNVEDVTSRVVGTLGTVLNIGEVSVQTAGEEREFEFEKMDNPSEIRDIISDLISNLKTGEHNYDR
jgi:hypothetical protein